MDVMMIVCGFSMLKPLLTGISMCGSFNEKVFEKHALEDTITNWVTNSRHRLKPP